MEEIGNVFIYFVKYLEKIIMYLFFNFEGGNGLMIL